MQYITEKRKPIIIMLTAIIVTIYIDKLGCFDVAELMQSFLWGFFVAGDIPKKHTMQVFGYSFMESTTLKCKSHVCHTYCHIET